MKSLLIAIKPKWCAMIMNGEKTIEVRKENVGKAVQKLIDEQGFADIYVCCTKGKQGIFKERHSGYTLLNQNKWIKSEMNGKVIFKFRCYKVEKICASSYSQIYYIDTSYERTGTRLFKDSCLTFEKLDNYLKMKNGWAIHISDLEIFDKPKELNEFIKSGTPSYEQTKPFVEIFGKPYTREEYRNQCEICGFTLSRAPQSFCYIEVEDK